MLSNCAEGVKLLSIPVDRAKLASFALVPFQSLPHSADRIQEEG